MTARDGRMSKLEQVFLRGGQIKFIVLPDLLKSAPILKKIQSVRAKTTEAPPRGMNRNPAGPAKSGPKK